MPQVDLESLMKPCSGASDHKITCETAIPDDFPPDSFYAEMDWFDRNVLYDRTESAKGNSNPNPALNSSSQRYSTNVKSKPSIIGLPKTQKTNYTDKNRKKSSKPGKVRLFPKRTASMNKPGQFEPSSPNVSCIGRVKSKRKNRKRVEPEKNRSRGICKQFLSMFRTKPVIKCDEPVREPVKWNVNKIDQVRSGDVEVEPGPPGLGAMKRFASVRQSSSSAADVAEVSG